MLSEILCGPSKLTQDYVCLAATRPACLAFSWALKWLLHGRMQTMAYQESTRCRGLSNKLRHRSKNRKAVDHKALGKQKGHALTSSFLSLSHSWTLLGLHTKATQRSCAFRNTEGPAITIFSYFRKHWSISANIQMHVAFLCSFDEVCTAIYTSLLHRIIITAWTTGTTLNYCDIWQVNKFSHLSDDILRH